MTDPPFTNLGSFAYSIATLSAQIEGLSEKGDHPVQKAWDAIDVPQCGYCQTGQMMTAAAFLKKNAKPSLEEIEVAMSGNICRCGTYHRIKEAVQLAATKM